MNPLFKFALGIATLAPLAFGIWALTRMLDSFTKIANQGGSASPGGLFEVFEQFAAMSIFVAFLSVGLLVFFLWHLFVKQASLDSTTQLLWAMGLVFCGSVAMLVYWFVFILPDDAMRKQDERIRERRRRRGSSLTG